MILTKRRPVRGRVRFAKRQRSDIDFLQLRREVKFMSNVAPILKASAFYQEHTAVMLPPTELR